jgi:hypothetical protein
MEKKQKIVSFEDMLKVNVNEFTEKKNGLTYLSWAHAWTEFKKRYQMASYEVVKTPEGLPYFVDPNLGIMVYTKVTVPNASGGEDLTHEMWLPVMDGANKPMKLEKYKYSGWGWAQGKKIQVEKTCYPANMFDINKTIMRCLVKNLAMFGLGLYIYAGEDLPEVEEIPKKEEPKEETKKTLKKVDFDRAVRTIEEGKYTSKELEEKFNLNATQQKTILNLKAGKNG